jgi:long-chain acyl-CoA synthetase
MENRFLAIIEDSVKTNWNLPAFSDYKGETYYYKDVALHIEKLHILFEQAGLKRGEKIALVGRNSSNWAISFFATLAYGAVVVPILHDFTPDNVRHIINHSEAKIVLAGSANSESLSIEAMPAVKLFMLLDNFSVIYAEEKEVYAVREQIDACFDRKYPYGFSKENISYHPEEPDELAVLNYTSGTTSSSKGVMLPYRSLWSNTKYANESVPFVKTGDNIVCMLPMAHLYGLAFEILHSVSKGCHVRFLTRTPSPKIVTDAFSAFRPTLILAVPLIIEKIIKNRVFPELEKPLVKFLLKIPVIRKKILAAISRKLNATFGSDFGEIVVGGAALNREVENFLRLINFRYTVGYGLTECGPLVAYEQWDTFKKGSVGRAVDRMEIRIDSPDPLTGVGDILVKGANCMLGYYKNPEATRAVMLPDGWMNTGDLGLIDADGFLFIKGRSKTMILSSNGQNIYPEEIEDMLNNKPYVSESLVISEGYKLTALIYPNLELLDKDGISPAETEKIMQQNVDELNAQMPVYSKVGSFKLMEDEFEKTPKRSIKRYLYQPKDE